MAEATALRLDRTRQAYTPVALRASILFFTIADLANVDPMYQYSLQWFIALFLHSISHGVPTDGDDALPSVQRLELLMGLNSRSVYRNVCRSLYEKDKLLFSFLMATSIMRGAGGAGLKRR